MGMAQEQGGDGVGEQAPRGGGSQGARRWRLGFLALSALLVASLAGCALPPGDTHIAVAPQIIRSSVRYEKEYLLAVGDQIEVSVWRNPEVSRSVVVRPDGFISLPLLQEVKAAGLTPRELAANIAKAYSNRLMNPEVTVIPTSVRQPTIYVLGDVKAPGAYPARNAISVAQALAAAGGALRTGSEDNTVVIRLARDGYLEAIPVGGGFHVSQTSAYLQFAATALDPDDIVFVPESGRSQVFRALSDLLVPFQIYLDYKLIETIVVP